MVVRCRHYLSSYGADTDEDGPALREQLGLDDDDSEPSRERR